MNTGKKLIITFICGLIAFAAFYHYGYEPVHEIHMQKIVHMNDSARVVSDTIKASNAKAKSASKNAERKSPSYPQSKLLPPANQGDISMLTINGCGYSVQIVEGDEYEFPEDLASYGMQLEKTVNGYVLTDTMQLNNMVSISGGSGNSVISISNNNSQNIDIVNGVVTVNGKVVKPGTAQQSRVLERKTLTIKIPRKSDLGLNGTGNFVLNATVPLGIFTAELNGSTNISLLSTTQIASIETNGSSSISVHDAGVVNALELNGSSAVSFASAASIASLDANGSSRLTLPAFTRIMQEETNGQSTVIRR